ncbi:cytochrome P450 [Streptomyces sp. BI20]|uniref:cytochrome P450 n=1 Tax=Streptomyces sp. BI20 TaxID=3403460 RepID=UPI003C785ABE
MTQTETLSYPQDRTCPYHPPTGYEPLREERPLSRASLFDGREVWVVTGHAVARALLSDGRLSTDRTKPGFPFPTARFKGLVTPNPALLGVDDPVHNTQRRMLIPSFGVKRIAALRPRVQETVDRLIDAMVAGGDRAELVGAFALPVPSIVICALLGVPYADHEFFEEQSRRLLRGPALSDVQEARARLDDYLTGLIAAKRVEPGDGLLDELIAQRLEPGEIDVPELVALATILLIAGHETTANMISLGTFTLLRHPERLAELRERPELMSEVVEELMRFLSIADGILRVATQDVEVAGTVIRAGEGVVFPASVINRDESVYPRPDELDFHRPTRHHVAFGFGIHQCLGQNLARAEMEIALTTLFARLPGLRLDAPPEEIPFKPGDTVQGMLALPVRW